MSVDKDAAGQHERRAFMMKLLSPSHVVTAILLLLCAILAGCQSTGLVVESVNNYGGRANLNNSIANGDGFIRAMTPAGGEWQVTHRFVDGFVWDTDFLQGTTWDGQNFDQQGTAISYYTGHGLANAYDEVPEHTCSTSSVCTNPPAGARLPGICKAAGLPGYAPGDVSRCVYESDRALVVNGNHDQFGGIVDYSSGGAKWGESRNAGGWAGVGTGGGTNVAVLDASLGVLPTYWVTQTVQAMAGLHMLATIMPVTGDTAIVSDRGSIFGTDWAVNANSAVSDSWLTTLLSIPGSGINGGGCNFVIAYDTTPDRAQAHLAESWEDVKRDGLDAQGAQFYDARWLCNWSTTIKDKSLFELP
jgi:hypothetical protein